jgi:DNA polymerase-3 subunit epsilon
MLCGLDLETTGLDIHNCHIVEISLVVVRPNTTRPLWAGSYLLYDSAKMGDHPMTPEVTCVNGLDNHTLQKFGLPPQGVLDGVYGRLKGYGVTHIVAHNGDGFDKPVLCRHDPRWGEFQWVDSKMDIEWDLKHTSHRLGHLAADRGFVNPFPHVALSDVLTMMRLLSEHDFDAVAERAKTPWVTVRAHVSYDEKDKAKARRYFFDPMEKAWKKRLKADKVDQEIADAGFKITVVT